jgi:hypothetical protein
MHQTRNLLRPALFVSIASGVVLPQTCVTASESIWRQLEGDPS